jgi:hypothetical protein
MFDPPGSVRARPAMCSNYARPYGPPTAAHGPPGIGPPIPRDRSPRAAHGPPTGRHGPPTGRPGDRSPDRSPIPRGIGTGRHGPPVGVPGPGDAARQTRSELYNTNWNYMEYIAGQNSGEFGVGISTIRTGIVGNTPVFSTIPVGLVLRWFSVISDCFSRESPGARQWDMSEMSYHTHIYHDIHIHITAWWYTSPHICICHDIP